MFGKSSLNNEDLKAGSIHRLWTSLYSTVSDVKKGIVKCRMLRDRPFNLQKGGLWFLVSFRIFFSDNTRVRIFFFGREFVFPEFNIRLYDQNSESDYFFFPPPKSEYFFSATLGIRIFFRKNP